MSRDKGTVRRGQLITTYGVGSVMAVADESFMVAGIDRWDVSMPDLHEPRLEKELKVDGFVLPPESGSGTKVPVVRFPTMYSCPGCNRLDEHRFFTSSLADNRCNKCGATLIPSRFVVVCQRGHIDEFPYFEWIHHGHGRSAAKHEMTIKAGGTTASLRDISISCSCDVPTRTMEGAFSKFAVQQVRKCRGRRPWLDVPAEECSETPRTLQRGASNVWFPIVHSALSIPPWSEGAFRAINRQWSALKWVTPDEALARTLKGMRLAEGGPYTVDQLVLAVKQRRAREEGAQSGDVVSLKDEEFEALCQGSPERNAKTDFVCVPAASIGPFTSQWFEQVQVVRRLREVRAVSAFGRLLPPSPGDPPEYRAQLYAADPRWLPGMEVSGEGLFFRIRSDSLTEWEGRAHVKQRVEKLDEHYRSRFAARGVLPDRVITPKLVLAHTLAHALINQFALDSGYPAAALRERIYVSESAAGMLIYTASSDSAGSLGGIVSQAEPSRLDATLREAVDRVSWCSADPLCIEADAAGVDSLNLAACHACVLLPEVSCEEMNLLLDRALLVGAPGDPSLGFFAHAGS